MITLIHNVQCHVWKKALDEIEAALKELALDINYCVLVVTTENQAQEQKFPGSPTIKVNGKDIDPMAENLTNYNLLGCRTYLYKDKIYEYPPKEMIKEALLKK